MGEPRHLCQLGPKIPAFANEVPDVEVRYVGKEWEVEVLEDGRRKEQLHENVQALQPQCFERAQKPVMPDKEEEQVGGRAKFREDLS